MSSHVQLAACSSFMGPNYSAHPPTAPSASTSAAATTAFASPLSLRIHSTSFTTRPSHGTTTRRRPPPRFPAHRPTVRHPPHGPTRLSPTLTTPVPRPPPASPAPPAPDPSSSSSLSPAAADVETDPQQQLASSSSVTTAQPATVEAPESDDATANGGLLLPSNREIDRSIAKIALPALGTLALDPLVALADMACVGHLGATALGGVGIGNNVFNLSFTCFNFLGLATTPAIARAFAKDDPAEASRLIAQALWVALISGAAATLLLSVFTRPILTFFGANATILPHAVAYLRARIVAAPFFLAAMVGNGSFRGFQDTRTPLFVGLIANLLNLVLYPTLIFAFKLGTRGAGIAMATGQICAGAALLFLLVRTRKLRLADLMRRPQLGQIFPLLRTGAVLSVRTLSIFSTISFATATAAKLGTVEVAAFEIGRQIFSLFARLLDAISVAAQSLVALALGKNDHRLARRTANRILQLAVAMGCGFVAALMLAINAAPSLFTANPAVRAMVSRTFPYMAVIQPINGLVFVFDGIFTAGRRFSLLSTAIFLAACAAWGVLAYARASALPLEWVWTGLNVMMVLRAAFLGIIYLTRWSPISREKFAAEGKVSTA